MASCTVWGRHLGLTAPLPRHLCSLWRRREEGDGAPQSRTVNQPQGWGPSASTSPSCPACEGGPCLRLSLPSDPPPPKREGSPPPATPLASAQPQSSKAGCRWALLPCRTAPPRWPCLLGTSTSPLISPRSPPQSWVSMNALAGKMCPRTGWISPSSPGESPLLRSSQPSQQGARGQRGTAVLPGGVKHSPALRAWTFAVSFPLV